MDGNHVCLGSYFADQTGNIHTSCGLNENLTIYNKDGKILSRNYPDRVVFRIIASINDTLIMIQQSWLRILNKDFTLIALLDTPNMERIAICPINGEIYVQTLEKTLQVYDYKGRMIMAHRLDFNLLSQFAVNSYREIYTFQQDMLFVTDLKGNIRQKKHFYFTIQSVYLDSNNQIYLSSGIYIHIYSFQLTYLYSFQHDIIKGAITHANSSDHFMTFDWSKREVIFFPIPKITLAEKMFSLALLVVDDYLIPRQEIRREFQRFLNIMKILPMEIQMTICQRLDGSGKSFTSKQNLDSLLRYFLS